METDERHSDVEFSALSASLNKPDQEINSRRKLKLLLWRVVLIIILQVWMSYNVFFIWHSSEVLRASAWFASKCCLILKFKKMLHHFCLHKESCQGHLPNCLHQQGTYNRAEAWKVVISIFRQGGRPTNKASQTSMQMHSWSILSEFPLLLACFLANLSDQQTSDLCCCILKHILLGAQWLNSPSHSDSWDRDTSWEN